MSHSKRKRELLKVAQEICPDVVIEDTNGNQIRLILTGPLGSRKVICAKTPSDHRDAKNVRRDIRAAARLVGTLPERGTTT